MGVVYFFALMAILFWPSPVDKPIGGTLSHLLQWLYSHGVPRWLVNYRLIEFTANIALFIPFGVIVALRLPRRRWMLTVVIAAAVSSAVELAQGVFLPARFPALSDIIANTAGGFIGALLVLFVWSLRRGRLRPSAA